MPEDSGVDDMADIPVTTQYHYPLAPLNYGLQLSSIVTVLLSVCVKAGVVLKQNADTANTWPYALDYVAVPIPAEYWSLGEEGGWLLLQCICNLLANVSYI